VEAGLTIALAAVLGLWKITLPWNFAGGSVSLVMLPIFVLAIRRGPVVGIAAGALFGVVDYFMEPYFVHPVQVVLDYGVAFAACGLAGFGSGVVRRSLESGETARAGVATFMWALVGSAGRFAASFVSGVVFFAANAPAGQPVLLYSAIYNLSYIAPSAIACSLAAAALVPALHRAVPSGRLQE